MLKRLRFFALFCVLIVFSGCVTDELANKQDVYIVRTQVNEQSIQLEDRINALEGQLSLLQCLFHHLVG